MERKAPHAGPNAGQWTKFAGLHPDSFWSIVRSEAELRKWPVEVDAVLDVFYVRSPYPGIGMMDLVAVAHHEAERALSGSDWDFMHGRRVQSAFESAFKRLLDLPEESMRARLILFRLR